MQGCNWSAATLNPIPSFSVSIFALKYEHNTNGFASLWNFSSCRDSSEDVAGCYLRRLNFRSLSSRAMRVLLRGVKHGQSLSLLMKKSILKIQNKLETRSTPSNVNELDNEQKCCVLMNKEWHWARVIEPTFSPLEPFKFSVLISFAFLHMSQRLRKKPW